MTKSELSSLDIELEGLMAYLARQIAEVDDAPYQYRQVVKKAYNNLHIMFNQQQPVEPTTQKVNGEGRLFCGRCRAMIPRWGKYCAECGRLVKRE